MLMVERALLLPYPICSHSKLSSSQFNNLSISFSHFHFSYGILNKTRSLKLASRFAYSNFDFQEEEEEEDYDEDEFDDGSSSILDQIVENVWIFKVFKSFGYTLPVVLLSFLIVGGLKAFLLALAVPVGQSALFVVYDKLFTGKKKYPNTKTRKKGFTRTNYSFYEKKDNRERSRRGQSRTNSDGNKNGFGGWDELNGVASTTAEPYRTRSESKTKLRNELGRKNETPLLLRLLLAVFPFLSSWTRMFW